MPGQRGWVGRMWVIVPTAAGRARAPVGPAIPPCLTADGAGTATATPHRSPPVPDGFGGGSHPAGSSILSLCPSSTHHPTPAGLTAAPIGVPRRGHGCGPRAEAGAMVPPSRACGSRGDPGRGLTPAPSHSGSSPTAAPPAPGPLPPLPGDTAGAGGDSSGVVPSTQRISTLGAAASWGWGHMGTLVGGGRDSRVTKAWGRGGVHWLQGFSMLGRQRAPAAVPGDIGDNLGSPPLAPQGGGVTPS